MSNKEHKLRQHRQGGCKTVSGRFRPNGAGAVSNTLNVGMGFTVARSAAGRFTITLDDKYSALLHATVTLWKTALPGDAYMLRVVSETVATDGAFVIEYAEDTAGTPAGTDLASDAATWISFEAVLRDTSVTF